MFRGQVSEMITTAKKNGGCCGSYATVTFTLSTPPQLALGSL